MAGCGPEGGRGTGKAWSTWARETVLVSDSLVREMVLSTPRLVSSQPRSHEEVTGIFLTAEVKGTGPAGAQSQPARRPHLGGNGTRTRIIFSFFFFFRTTSCEALLRFGIFCSSKALQLKT